MKEILSLIFSSAVSREIREINMIIEILFPMRSVLHSEKKGRSVSYLRDKKYLITFQCAYVGNKVGKTN
jgi:hypothetical protein